MHCTGCYCLQSVPAAICPFAITGSYLVELSIFYVTFKKNNMRQKYHVLEWEAMAIHDFLNLPGTIDFAVFNFYQPPSGPYVLSATGFDVNGVLLGTSPLQKYPGAPEPDLENVYTG